MERNLRIPATVDLAGYIRVLLKTAENVKDAGCLYAEELLECYDALVDTLNRKDDVLSKLSNEMTRIKNEIQKCEAALAAVEEGQDTAGILREEYELTVKYNVCRTCSAAILSRFDAFEENIKKYDQAVQSFQFTEKVYVTAESLEDTAKKMQTFTDWVDSVQWGYSDV